MRAVILRILAVLALAATTPALAESSCRIATSGLAFGVYDPMRAQPSTSVASFDLECTGVASIVATLEVENVAAPYRSLASGKHRIAYQIFQDAAYTRRWLAPVTLSAGGASGRVGSATVRVPIYGLIAPRQWVEAGTYQDQVRITLTY